MKKLIYLANPYGFSERQRETLLPELVSALEGIGLSVWEPFARTEPIDRADPSWPYLVGQRDKFDVMNADGIFAVVNGCPPDEGVMVEVGIAIALGKPTFLFRDDFRRATDNDEYPLNLMVFTGLPEDNWREYYYTSVSEINDPGKALARWVAGTLPAVGG